MGVSVSHSEKYISGKLCGEYSFSLTVIPNMIKQFIYSTKEPNRDLHDPDIVENPVVPGLLIQSYFKHLTDHFLGLIEKEESGLKKTQERRLSKMSVTFGDSFHMYETINAILLWNGNSFIGGVPKEEHVKKIEDRSEYKIPVSLEYAKPSYKKPPKKPPLYTTPYKLEESDFSKFCECINSVNNTSLDEFVISLMPAEIDHQLGNRPDLLGIKEAKENPDKMVLYRRNDITCYGALDNLNPIDIVNLGLSSVRFKKGGTSYRLSFEAFNEKWEPLYDATVNLAIVDTAQKQ